MVGDGRREEGHAALHDARRMRKLVGEVQRAFEVSEGHQRLEPRMRGCQRDLQLQHQSVGAPQVVHAHRLGAAQLHDLRLGLDGHRADADHVARRAQRSVVDGAHATEAAAEQPAQRRAAVGRWNTAQLLPRGLRLLLEFAETDAGLRARHAGAHPQAAVVARHVEHHAAGQRRGLAVVAGAAAADGDGHAAARAGADHRADLFLGARPHDHVGALVLELAYQHGAEPGEVGGQPRDAAFVGDPVEVGQFEQQLLDGGNRGVHGQGSVL